MEAVALPAWIPTNGENLTHNKTHQICLQTDKQYSLRKVQSKVTPLQCPRIELPLYP